MKTSRIKRVLSAFLSAAVLMTTMGVFQAGAAGDTAQLLEDMALIKSRFAERFLTDNVVSKANVGDVDTYMDSQKADGSWQDIDYYDHTNDANGLLWQPYVALDRIEAMAIAFNTRGNPHYQDAAMLSCIQKGLEHWRSIRDANPGQADYEGPWSENWWANGFGVGQRMYQIGILLEKVLTADNLAMICRKLDKFGSTGTGQNALWQTQNALHRAMLEKDAAQFQKIVDECLSVNLGRSDVLSDEALMVDNSFHAHGNLMYSNGYGKSLIQDLSWWIYFLRDTSFALPQKTLDLIADYILDGNRWMIRGELLEMGTLYKPYDGNWAYENYAEPIQRLIASDPARADEYQIFLDNLEGKRVDNGLSGNKAMWTSAYMSHMRKGYGVNVRTDTAGMKSTEWRSTWPDEELGCLVFWTTAGMTTVAVDGDEYSSVIPTYDWRHIPGTTTPYYFSDRYNDFDNGNDDSISVSNGTYGSISYTFDKTDIRPKTGDDYSGATTGGKQSVFFFDDEYVALGADIHSNHKAPIHTAVNQTKAADAAVNGQNVASGTQAREYTAAWVYNNKIGYIFPKKTVVNVSNLDQTGKNPSLFEQTGDAADTFSLWIDHGVAPKDASYAYIVLPDATEEETAAYSADNKITIVANSKKVQAVRHEGLKQTQINFYTAGSLEYAPGKTVTVDGACSLIIDESGSVPVLTLAVSNTQPETIRTVQLKTDETNTYTMFRSDAQPYAGQSITLTAGDSSMIESGNSAQGHNVGQAFDNREDTAWKAASAEDTWILYDMRETMDLDKLTIRWGEVYATKYDVLISADGQKWTTVYSEENGDGVLDEIKLQASGRYWKLVCKELSANGGADIAEISFTDKDFPLATPEYPDMSALKQAISQSVQEDLYTKESVAVYQQAIKKAQKLMVLPYATKNLVEQMTTELNAAIDALSFRDLGRVMATLAWKNPTISGHKQTLGTAWTDFDSVVDLDHRDLSKIYVFFTLTIDCEEERAGMFSSGRIMLKSSATDGKENSVYCTIPSLKLHKGENVLYLPLTSLTGKNGSMDWSDLRAFRMYVDSLNQYDLDVSLTFSDIEIRDSENRPPDSPEKSELKELLRAQRTDLTLYTLESAAAYNDLFLSGWEVYHDIEATGEEVTVILEKIRNADSLLVLDENAKIVVGTLLDGEKHSPEKHDMQVTVEADTPIDLTPYTEGELYLQFDMRVDTSHTDPAPSSDDWLKKVLNGRVDLGESGAASRTNIIKPLHSSSVVTRSGAWSTVRVVIPAELRAKGNIQSFFINQFNDTSKLNGENGTDADGIAWSDSSGVSFSIRNIKVLADKPEGDTVDRTALKAALDKEKTDALLTGYTPASVAAYKGLYAAALAVYRDDTATQAQVNEAFESLKNADGVLVADKTALTALIAEMERLDTAPYTVESVKDFTDALTAAKAMANSDSATPAQIRGAIADLQAAKNALEKREDPFVLGDVDGKDGVTAADALLALQAATNKVQLSPAQLKAADVDGKDGVTASDALLILQYATRKITSF